MYSMFSTPTICCSIGAATVSATTLALAPGYWQVTETVGGVISGYWATGSLTTDTSPASVMTMEITDARMGRLMKTLESTAVLRELSGTRAGSPARFRGAALRLQHRQPLRHLDLADPHFQPHPGPL